MFLPKGLARSVKRPAMASSGVRASKWTRNLDTVSAFLDTEFTETEGNWKVQNQAQAIESERHPVSASYSGFPPRTDCQSGCHGFDPVSSAD